MDAMKKLSNPLPAPVANRTAPGLDKRAAMQKSAVTARAESARAALEVHLGAPEQAAGTITLDRIKAMLEKQLGVSLPDTAALPSKRGADGKPDLGEFSPEAVSGRIAGFATGFFDAYLQQHRKAGEEDAAILDRYMSTVRGAVEEGFSQALGVLSSNPLFDSSITDETHGLTFEKLDKFERDMREKLGLEQVDQAEPAATASDSESA
ncbi:MAG: DUF5610 domain-containing protein [Candidatus Schekmanbacteria bacterium]|nr:DUF5610 domain-containing protein [Candidatus Schekmanbacteria bacterium]